MPDVFHLDWCTTFEMDKIWKYFLYRNVRGSFVKIPGSIPGSGWAPTFCAPPSRQISSKLVQNVLSNPAKRQNKQTNKPTGTFTWKPSLWWRLETCFSILGTFSFIWSKLSFQTLKFQIQGCWPCTIIHQFSQNLKFWHVDIY